LQAASFAAETALIFPIGALAVVSSNKLFLAQAEETVYEYA